MFNDSTFNGFDDLKVDDIRVKALNKPIYNFAATGGTSANAVR